MLSFLNYFFFLSIDKIHSKPVPAKTNPEIKIQKPIAEKYIHIKNLKPGSVIILSDAGGKELDKRVAENSIQYLDLKGYLPGIYIVNVFEFDRVETGKFIKQ